MHYFVIIRNINYLYKIQNQVFSWGHGWQMSNVTFFKKKLSIATLKYKGWVWELNI